MSALTAHLDLRATMRSPRTARHLVDELLTAWAARRYRDDAALIVSELVTNVVEHVGPDVDLVVELSLSDAALRMSVADGSAVRPVVQELSDHAPRGRGIRLIAALADRWGCEDHAGGKRIWVELRPPEDEPCAGNPGSISGAGWNRS